MQRRNLLLAAAAAGLPAAASMLNIAARGAKGDGRTLNTKAIQAAIDACAQGGGGTVFFPPGRYLSGTLVLRSHVRLHLDAGAVLLGSTNLADYPATVPGFRSYTDVYVNRSLLYAENVQDIAIEGRGVIDGQGARYPHGPYLVRPYLLRMIGCRDVGVCDVTMRDSPMWVQHYLNCDNVAIRGITVHSRVNENNDGIDIDCCARVRIADCDISSGDDAIVLKSTADRVCRDVVITNCVLSSACNALKLGTETNGGFENISVANCAIYDTRLSGIGLHIVDGGTMDRILVSNLAIHGIGAPVFIRLGNRARPFVEGGPRPGIGKLRNVQIRGIEATGASRIGCSITGLPGHDVENVTIENIRAVFAGGGTAADAARPIPEKPEGYPEHHMFGVLPSYGFFVRHARNVRFRDMEISYADREERPGFVCEDVERLSLDDVRIAAPAGEAASLVLRDVRDGVVRACRPSGRVARYARVEGARTADLVFRGNDFRLARQAVETAPETPAQGVLQAENLAP